MEEKLCPLNINRLKNITFVLQNCDTWRIKEKSYYINRTMK